MQLTNTPICRGSSVTVKESSECEKGSSCLSLRGRKILALEPPISVEEKGYDRRGKHTKKHHKLVHNALLDVACFGCTCSAFDRNFVEGHTVKHKVSAGNNRINNAHSVEPYVEVYLLQNPNYREELGDKCYTKDSHHAVVFHRVCLAPIISRR